MGLAVGSEDADSGMSQAIYQEMDRLLSPPLQAVDEETLDAARDGWKKLSFAIAKGVIEHITANMEIFGIETQGDVNTTVQGDTGPALPDNHQHQVALSGEADDVVFIQSNDGTGHVR